MLWALWWLVQPVTALPTMTPPAIVQTVACQPGYSYTDWEQTREEHGYEGTWVVAYRHYRRTRTDMCTNESTRETRVEGPIRLWPAMPHAYTEKVSAPEGGTAVSGTPLRTSDPPYMFQPVQVGPQMEAPEPRTTPTTPAQQEKGAAEPLSAPPVLILLAGLVGYLLGSRRLLRSLGWSQSVALGSLLISLFARTAHAGGHDQIPFETRLGPVPERPLEPIEPAPFPTMELPWLPQSLAFVKAGLKQTWQPLALTVGGLVYVFGEPGKWIQSAWERVRGGWKRKQPVHTRQPGEVTFDQPRAEGSLPICTPPAEAEVTTAAITTVRSFYGLLPRTVEERLSPSEARFMAEYITNVMDSGDVVAYGRNHAEDLAHYQVLLNRLMGANLPVEWVQQEIAMATGKVFPLWELLAIKMGKLDRSPSPLDLPPEAVLPEPDVDLGGLSFLVGISPVGDYYDGAGALTGRDLITGEELAWWERALSALGVIPLLPGGALADAIKALRKGGKAADLARPAAIDLIRKALPNLSEAAAARLVSLIEWADGKMAQRIAEASEEMAQVGASDMVPRWLTELEPYEAVRMIEHYRDNRHLLGAMNEARMGQQLKQLVQEQKALLLHFNEAVNQGGADLIWIDLKTNRVVFADVKASVSGTTISRVKTFTKRMKENIEQAMELINDSAMLTDAEKSELRKALRKGNFDLQVVLAGTARESASLRANLLDTLRKDYPDAQVRETLHLDQ